MTTPAIWRRETSTDGLATLWLDTPARSVNVVDSAALDALEAQLIEVVREPALKALVIRSAKPSGFAAGFDPAAILASTPDQLRAIARRGQEVFDRLERLTIPTVAILHGVCQGAGLDLALACQRRVALASSGSFRLAAADVLLGLISPWGMIERLPHIIAPADALGMLLNGRSIGFLMARSMGLVDRLASDENVHDLQEVISAPIQAQPVRSSQEWESAWNHAQAGVEEHPGEHYEAQLQILSVVSILAAHGPQAARDAATEAFVTLAEHEDTRLALEAAAQRGEA